MPERHLHIDAYSGAAGNMLLGALLALGVPRRVLNEAIGRIGLEGVRMRVRRVRRGPLHAVYVDFRGPERTPRERQWRSIRRLLQRADLPPRVRARSLDVFARLARAEGRVHGIDPERVHFHELGAVDALCDIVGVCAALEHLDPTRISVSSLPLGRGSVATEHGRIPLPAPAVLELLVGVPTHPLDVEWETVTPTGAALLAALADEFGGMPALRPRAIGYGAGDDRVGPLPNTLRMVLGEVEAWLGRDRVSVLETHLDDMPPEQLPFLLDRLMEAGALDAALSPLAMKKGRPGQLLRVLARPTDAAVLAQRILLESTALGVRVREEARLLRAREAGHVATRYGRIRIKRAFGPDGRVDVAPEYESCARAARRHGARIRDVYRAAERSSAEDLA